MKILAIESSCDEFSISIIEEDKILCNIISSQIKDHQVYGGVVPELAARLHLQNMHIVLQSALKETETTIESIDYVAYTEKPGLIGSLIVGKTVAEAIALYIDKPLLPLHHIEGHIFGASINHKFVYPVLALVVSGGHTQIELVHSPNEFEIIGTTQDDAIGECYDKVARVLGMGYPGGPLIDKLAQTGNSSKYLLPIAKNDNSFDFSYSGLKTAAINLIHNAEQKHEKLELKDFCATFQFAATSILKIKLEKAVQKFKPLTLTVAGGVSANSSIRKLIMEIGNTYNLNTIIPDLEYCTDNAAMIAKLAREKLINQNH
ncbi:tRNA N6-adenosine(37)-threonylcarbamoyltransferase complex transferase subunit TsaD [Williamsoniiplasma somnilux]|uniref:tRNA N6-adenosine threonylcarbamoyltransferase n=1 Tax=Williamsoniiplasma somnilux TaxID=215578 RepID=A0A2K8P296_9MOLU|nr:tRNA (adenosine(37)-N6)-threonylcarbamoyltransferase complex transferase subunit TsaD [Williamsoniiplasma somnilux]ATZ19013.1 tRNA N6-adenosine(37)-threonylcarbamoyltransferase complex transferase subunit TsaD [Williamsoniiplasma somnilux]